MVGTALWREAQRLPDTLRATLSQASLEETAALLRDTDRIVATGNGAAFYVAQALWLASLGATRGPEVLALPAGLLHGFAWRPADRMLVVSSSGELRDVVELLDRLPRPFAVVTSSPESTLANAATARVPVHVESQVALTHTQAYVGNLVATLALWARLSEDDRLGASLDALPAAVDRVLAFAPAWAARAADDAGAPRAVLAFGAGPAWAAALEAALLVREVARIPADGAEAREGATTGMYALAPGQLVVALPTGADAIVEETARVCASTGATVVRAPGGELADPRLAAATTFPAALALAIELGLRAGHDVDNPSWADTYYATARVNTTDMSTDTKEQ